MDIVESKGGGGGVEVKARPGDGWHADFLGGASEIIADNLTYKILVVYEN